MHRLLFALQIMDRRIYVHNNIYSAAFLLAQNGVTRFPNDMMYIGGVSTFSYHTGSERSPARDPYSGICYYYRYS